MDESESPLAIVAKYQKEPPVNLIAIAQELGIEVYYQPLGPKFAGKITRKKDHKGESHFTISVNVMDHPNRKRFTLAHELAHFILHRDLFESEIVDDEMYRSKLSNEYEVQANQMAADILMPLTLVRKYWIQGMNDPGQLAQLFGVSRAAMDIRLKSLRNVA